MLKAAVHLASINDSQKWFIAWPQAVWRVIISFCLWLNYFAVFRALQAFSPVSELRTEEILALGSLVTEMTVRELHDTSLSDLAVLAHLGTLSSWHPKKVNWIWPTLTYKLVNVPKTFVFSDKSSNFGCVAQAQPENRRLVCCRFGNIWPSDLWTVSLRD